MWLLTMAWKNLWRNKQRAIITMSAVFFAVILASVVSSLQKGVFDNLIKNIVSYYSGYIQVHRKGYWNEQVLDNSMEKDSATESKILQQPQVLGSAPRLEAFALASSEEITKGCLVVGVDPVAENKVIQLQSKLIRGSYIQPNENKVLVAQGLADRLKLGVSDTLVLIGQGYQGTTAAGKFAIKGILKFGSPVLNDQVVFLALPIAQELYGAENRLTSYVLSIQNADELDGIARQVKKALPPSYEVMTWEEMTPDVKQHIRTDTAGMSIIIGILYLLIGFGIFGTVLMMMVERKYELGMLMAVGMKKGKLSVLLLTESVLMVCAGCLLGLLASVPIVYYLNLQPIRLKGDIARSYERFGFEAIFPTAIDAQVFLRQGLIVLFIGLLISLYPVIKILQLNAVEAMRK